MLLNSEKSQYSLIDRHYTSLFSPQKGFVDYVVSENLCGSLIDLGCGPGLYLDLFLSKGYNVKGLELNPSLANQATTNARSQISIGDIKELETWRELLLPDLSLVFCIGNTLSYLEQDEIIQLLNHLKQNLNVGSRIIFQTVNWPSIMSKKSPFGFSEKQFGNLKFNRKYEWKEIEGPIHFTLTLEDHQKIDSETHDLYPIFPEKILKCLEMISFSSICFYGDWKKSLFDEEKSSSLIIDITL
jgi:SAM-dependent methyltransferase